MALGKRKPLARQAQEFRTGQDGVAEATEAVSHADQLSPEFLDVIRDWDPGAANDRHYVTSSDFIEFQSRMRKYVIRRLILWVTSAVLGMSVLWFVYQ